jgi:Zn-dependent protease
MSLSAALGIIGVPLLIIGILLMLAFAMPERFAVIRKKTRQQENLEPRAKIKLLSNFGLASFILLLGLGLSLRLTNYAFASSFFTFTSFIAAICTLILYINTRET